jgi:hypothetical protein
VPTDDFDQTNPKYHPTILANEPNECRSTILAKRTQPMPPGGLPKCAHRAKNKKTPVT